MSDPAPQHRFWRQEYCGEWWDRPGYDQLRQLAEWYHEETERFDQLVCTGRSERGVAIPTDAWQRREITAHARQLDIDLCWLARQLGFTWEDWRDERGAAADRLHRREREARRE